MTTVPIATGDYTVTSLLCAAVGYVLEALINDDVLLACNLLSQMVTHKFLLFTTVTMVTGSQH